MKIAKIDFAIEKCLNHINNFGINGTEVEAYLTRYLNVLIYSAFEEELKKIIVESISMKYNDKYLNGYMRESINRICRSIKVSEIAGILNHFGSDIKQHFNEIINKDNAGIYFNNIVVNRHKIAHEEGSNFTLRELIENYEKGHIVLDAVKNSLYEY